MFFTALWHTGDLEMTWYGLTRYLPLRVLENKEWRGGSFVGQVGRGHRVELQASTADTEQARDARGSYTSMGMHPMTGRERSRIVTSMSV